MATRSRIALRYFLMAVCYPKSYSPAEEASRMDGNLSGPTVCKVPGHARTSAVGTDAAHPDRAGTETAQHTP